MTPRLCTSVPLLVTTMRLPGVASSADRAIEYSPRSAVTVCAATAGPLAPSSRWARPTAMIDANMMKIATPSTTRTQMSRLPMSRSRTASRSSVDDARTGEAGGPPADAPSPSPSPAALSGRSIVVWLTRARSFRSGSRVEAVPGGAVRERRRSLSCVHRPGRDDPAGRAKGPRIAGPAAATSSPTEADSTCSARSGSHPIDRPSPSVGRAAASLHSTGVMGRLPNSGVFTRA